MSGGPLAVVENGDIILVDVRNRRLELKVSESELQARLRRWKAPETKVKKGILAVYSKMVKSTPKGAGFLF